MFGEHLREIAKNAIEAEKEKSRRKKIIKDEQERLKIEILKSAFSGRNFYEIPATNGQGICLDFLEDPEYVELKFYKKINTEKKSKNELQN